MEGKWKNGLTNQDQHRVKRVICLVGLYACTLLLSLGSARRQYQIVRLGWKPILFRGRRLPIVQLSSAISYSRSEAKNSKMTLTYAWRVHEDILSLDLARSSLGQSFSGEDPQ